MNIVKIANNKVIDKDTFGYMEHGTKYPIIKIEVSDEIYQAYLEDIRKVIYQDGQVVLNPDYEEIKANERKAEFESKFLLTSKGNYRLQPKGYANAQQSVDTINGMVNALNGLTQQIAQIVIFYPTPDFTKEEWTEFYIEFSTLYAMNQYKKANENVN